MEPTKKIMLEYGGKPAMLKELPDDRIEDIAVSTRLNSFSARPEGYKWKYGPRDPRDMLHRAEEVKGLHYVSLNYPEHFPLPIEKEMTRAVLDSRLKVSTINLRYRDIFSLGAFTHPDSAVRAQAQQVTFQAIDKCSELKGSDVVIWPGCDGFDYPFQMDYATAWALETEAIARAADYAADLGIRLSVEYKPCEPRKYSLLGNFGLTLAAMQELDRKNLGITCDFCHMIIARESPAQSVGLALAKGKLFGLHLNDGYGQEDDGLPIATVNLFSTLEVLKLLNDAHFDGFIYFDTFTTNEDPVEECMVNLFRFRQLDRVARRINTSTLNKYIQAQEGLKAQQHVFEQLFFEEER